MSLTLDYQPRLDGIRAIAVALVLQNHFMVGYFSLGGLGVNIFFVLSGYLISRIIFDYKLRDVSIGSAAGQFYWRRFLRLTPPLYLAIAVTALLGIGGMRADWLWHASYLTNFKIYFQKSWGPATHFWTLAVEEQFYLVWFFLLIVTPLRRSFSLIVSGIIAGFTFRIATYASGDLWSFVLLPSTISYFCAGAFIAYAESLDRELDARLIRLFSGWKTVALAFGSVLLSLCISDLFWQEVTYIIASLFFSFCLIISARNAAKAR